MGMPYQMGLAILAGALGLAFSNLEKISKFKGAGFEAEMNMVRTIIENQTEPTQEQLEEAKQKDEVTEAENTILKRLQKPGYTWRYAKTVAKEAALALPDTEKCLLSLMCRGLAKNSKGSNGEIWAITTMGKSLQEQYELKASKQLVQM
ncbi:MAG: hypothetical protein ACD_9C00228G0003 [uncultured bacterium]|nr:MAG: hypothetical protein ACD_9C00228G0003 [uncultured bacterium]